MCMLLIWRQATFVLRDAALVAECADSLRRWSYRESTGLMHPAAASFVCAMHAGEQAGAV